MKRASAIQLRLTDDIVKEAKPPTTRRYRILWDTEVRRFGIRIMASGERTFVFTYRALNNGRWKQRVFTIGRYDDPWRTSAARERARDLKAEVRLGRDPFAEMRATTDAPTMTTLWDRYQRHVKKQSDGTQIGYEALWRNHLEPSMGRKAVAEVTFDHCDRLHSRIEGPYAANRALVILSGMFKLAIRLGWRSDNPVVGIERNEETERQRYLSGQEMTRLAAALAAHADQEAADALRLLLLTGARKNEVLSSQWPQFDLEARTWTKPASVMKGGEPHAVPLNDVALDLLKAMRAKATGPYLFPSRVKDGPRRDLKREWAQLREAADIADVRIHDLRHSFASLLASSGETLHLIGKLLAHRHAETTKRYAHIHVEPLRAAVDKVGAAFSEAASKKPAEVVTFRPKKP
jgi:integrase